MLSDDEVREALKAWSERQLELARFRALLRMSEIKMGSCRRTPTKRTSNEYLGGEEHNADLRA